MPTNPKENRDATSNQATSNPDSWSAPKGTGQRNFIKLDNDDLHPERVERLGQYLSDATTVDTPQRDSRGGQANHFPIAPPGETTEKYVDTMEDAVSDAVEYFRTLSQQTSFDPEVFLQDPESQVSGHELLQNKAQSVVETSIDINTSRWAGIGKQQFPPNTGESNSANRYQVQRATENLDGSEPGGTTKFESYQHKTGQNTVESQGDGRTVFWDNYFERMGLVGPKITLGATGRDLPSDDINLGKSSSGVLSQGAIDEEGLEGDYGKKEIGMTEAGEVFLTDELTPDRYEALSKEFEMTKRPLSNTQTWGQMNSFADPFEAQAGFPLVENQGLEVAKQLLEIWSMVVLKLLVTTSLLQISSYLISLIGQNIGQTTGGDSFAGVNWNRNYYSPDPQVIPGSSFFKGSSGFNHPATDIITRALDSVSKVTASLQGVGGGLAQGAIQVPGPAVNVAGQIVEQDLLNLTVQIQRELNIYIPRHILSTMANETGYNNSAGPVKASVNIIAKSLDIYTAYVRAYTAGMLTMTATIAGQDFGRSLGFWKVLFRSVVRSKSQWGTRKTTNSAYENMLNFCGKDDKVMKFANYLARIGDLGTASGQVGAIAFPENKVKLDLMKDFPTLRTAGGRKFGERSKSKLALTDTPSLLLVPKNSALVKHRLASYGVDPNGNYAGTLEGLNNLYKTDDEIDSNIALKFQSSPNNRFTPDQVRMMEDQLEAEHMPFYIQDMRTNEIISFHAFLTSLSDSYSADWSAQKGFGRMEAAQIYGGGSRAIGVSFMMVSMNPEDFNEMYYKINKLTTLVYPQWSEGTFMEGGGSKFIQPFSQVPTASPLCRLRVGDLFTSNYSKVAMARMMGIGKKEFVYTEPGGEAPKLDDNGVPLDAKDIKERGTASEQRNNQISSIGGGKRIMKRGALRKFLRSKGFRKEDLKEQMDGYSKNPNSFVATYDTVTKSVAVQIINDLQKIGDANEVVSIDGYLSMTKSAEDSEGLPIPLISQPTPQTGAGLASLFGATDADPNGSNPILKSFNSTMGRGIAVAITAISLDWKLNSVPWNLEPGSRAPRMCEVQLSVTPIHDITPGLDHQGINRAPIYKVGDMSESLTGDVWYDTQKYGELTDDIAARTDAYLSGEENSLNGIPEDKK